jgi:nucleoside-diphosphate-sugar epimerase
MVTGGSGFIGAHLCDQLEHRGANVYAVSRSARVTAAGAGQVQWLQADLGEIAQVRSLLSSVKPDIIFHFSGIATATTSLDLVLPTYHALLSSTVNLLTAATENGCARIVIPASMTEPNLKDGELTPSSPYAAAKSACTAYARLFHGLYRTPVVIAKVFQTFGPGQDVCKLIPLVTLALLRGQAPKLSNGRWEVDWIYIDDLVKGLLRAAQAPGIEGSTIDIGTGTTVSVRHVVERLVHLTGSKVQPVFGALEDRQSEQARPAADVTSTFTRLGWKPLIDLREGLKRTVNWYQQRLKEGMLSALLFMSLTSLGSSDAIFCI